MASQNLDNAAARRVVAGIDIGGTNQTVALALPDGTLLDVRRRTLPAGGTALTVREHVTTMLDEVLAAVPGVHLAAIGVGFGGPVDAARGVVVTSHHVPGWTGFPLGLALSERFGVPVALENDANAGALGEATFGAGGGAESLLYVNVGTGIGAGIVMQGRLLRGAQGLAGEIGHVTVVPDGPECPCGKKGCLEAVASGRSLARRAREAVASDPHRGAALLEQASGDPDAISGRHVLQAAQAGDALALALFQETAAYLGLVLGNAANLLDPAVIVVGGGVGEAGDVLFSPLRQAVVRHVMPGMRPPPVLPAALGYDSGVLGAVAVGLSALDQSGVSAA